MMSNATGQEHSLEKKGGAGECHTRTATRATMGKKGEGKAKRDNEQGESREYEYRPNSTSMRRARGDA